VSLLQVVDDSVCSKVGSKVVKGTILFGRSFMAKATSKEFIAFYTKKMTSALRKNVIPFVPDG
jgi:hypothetical protein